MPGTKSDCIFLILSDIYDPENGYPLFVIWPGYMFFFEAHFYCGHDLDLAMEYVNELNITLGHDPAFVARCIETILNSTSNNNYHA